MKLADFFPQLVCPIADDTAVSLRPKMASSSQEMGLLGKLFGSREHAPLNIAGSIALIGLVGLLFSLLVTGQGQADVAKTFGAIVLAALTFLGGYLSAK